MLEIVACRNRNIRLFLSWLHLGQVSKFVAGRTSKPNCTFKITQTIHLLSPKNMAIPLAHLVISTLELAARVSPTLCCQRIHHSASTPPISAPPRPSKGSWSKSLLEPLAAGLVRPISFQLLGKVQTEPAVLALKIRTGTCKWFSFFGGSRAISHVPRNSWLHLLVQIWTQF